MTAQFRIASLVPSLTETLFSLGLGDQVVARTGYCTHPAQAHSVPKVGGTKTVNLDKLAQLMPTHVLLNRDENTLETLAAVQAFTPAPMVLSNHPIAPLDNFDVFQTLGQTFHVQAKADDLCAQFRSAFEHVQNVNYPKKRVLYLIWQDPWMTVARNTYISQTMALFGLETYPAIQGALVGASRYPKVDDLAQCISEHSIDAVLLSTEPYSFTQAHCNALQAQLNVPVHLIDGELCSWYGSRAIVALPALASWVRSL